MIYRTDDISVARLHVFEALEKKHVQYETHL